MFTKSFLMFAFLVATEAHGALLGRVPLTPGSTDYQAYYDDGLDITWTRNANLAATLTPSLPGMLPSGVMQWKSAQQLIADLNLTSSDFLISRETRLALLRD